jgi:hypothetical protein
MFINNEFRGMGQEEALVYSKEVTEYSLKGLRNTKKIRPVTS